ncbi:phosphotransferase [Dictyobacter aurantiacus]|uniref:Aminoglycoside phosphotransferase domain-containing protein n=1 Tax=Dictyobacter aurantiacus TaxID=1936993 RepID=A0A401ZDB3_9CHLR|nr:phosphotransferase [Dictyobacter aurantiacus]GCE04839.1 hypothetical protein KDAU_21680 [Dictyobacter aurantiacus]
MDFQPLFESPILEQKRLDPGYAGHMNDVWRITTRDTTCVIRVLRPEKLSGPFWTGCLALFGIDPTNIFDLEHINATLNSLSTLSIPQILSKGTLDGRAYVMVECMAGSPLTHFGVLSDAALERFGQQLAHIHALRFPYYGHPTGRQRGSFYLFHQHLVQTMEALVEQYHADDLSMKEALQSISASAHQLADPVDASLIMVDMDPTQLLVKDGYIEALVDTEAYALGPRALDFIALEYILSHREANALARGYRSVLPLPDLTAVRPVYRYFYRLLEIQGRPDIASWLAHPILF